MRDARPSVRLATRPPLGVLLFASGRDEHRSRRPTDIALAVVSVLLLLAASIVARIGANIDTAVGDLIDALPGLLDPIWRVLFWAPGMWAAVLLAITLGKRRALARDLVASAALATLLAVAVGAVVTDGAWRVLTAFFDPDGPPSYPPGALTLAVAMISTASPHLSRPFRHFGRWLILATALASLMLGSTTMTGGLAALAVGLLAAAVVHLVVGSPGGRPTTSRIRLALAGLGVNVDELVPASMHREGVLLYTARDAEGPLAVKVYGRDAWDGQLLANVWRALWYRGAERTVRLSRLELVEHEGFVTLLAERAGVRVPYLVAAGSAGRGDALVVVRPGGTPLSAIDPDQVTDAGLTSLWHDLARLHGAGIVQRRVDLDLVLLRPDGTVGLGDLASAFVSDSPSDALRDLAQALGLCLLVVGEERAVAVARAALGDDRLLSVLPYLQGAALPTGVRDGLAGSDVELDDVRNRLRVTLGADEQPLIKLRRVTWGSVFNVALLAIAAYTMIALLGDVDLETFLDELSTANWWWLAFALVLAQLPRIPSAVSTMGSIERRLPLGPLTALQFAICYVNLAIPSTAARVAINVRFFQRFGVKPATAMSAGAIDSVSGFVVQIAIFVLLFFSADLDLGLSTDTTDISGLATIALIALAVIVVAVIVIVAVPAVRNRALAALREARDALRVLRSPTKVLQLFGGNLLSQVLFAVALSTCVFAFGEEVPLSTLLLINTVVSLFAGLLPIPGGMGVTEAGLTLGLTTAGLSSETAFAIALSYRFASFYLPPIWGLLCYRWLIKRRYL